MKIIKYLVLLIFLALPAAEATAKIIYVDAAAFGFDDGTSWLDAYTDLQLALGNAVAGDEIWVAMGTGAYYPSFTDRSASFNLVDGVVMYGGFFGGFFGEASPQERLPGNRSVLSGAINLTDNSYHVVRANGTGAATLLDGFSIEYGRADGPGIDREGAGLLLQNASLTVQNCVFSFNRASGLDSKGGAVMNTGGGTARFINCSLTDAGAQNGGLIYNDQSSTLFLEECTIGNTSVGGVGGSIYNNGGDIYLTNGYVYNTFAGSFGGGIANIGGGLVVNNTYFWINSGTVGGAIYNDNTGFVFVNQSTFHKCLANTGSGGAIENTNNSRLHVINSTFSDNESSGPGGAIYNDVDNGVVITHSTFTENRANTSLPQTGGAIYNSGFDGVLLSHTLLVDNHPQSIGQISNLYADLGNKFQSLGNNMVSDASSLNDAMDPEPSDQVFGCYLNCLGELADNLGLPRTTANPFRSEAISYTHRLTNPFPIDEGNHNGLVGDLNPLVNAAALQAGFTPDAQLFPSGLIDYTPLLEVDQRGVKRDAQPDIGAYEERYTTVQVPDTLFLCPYSDTVALKGDIAIVDSTGGAFLPGENQTLILEIPFGFEFVPDRGGTVGPDPIGQAHLGDLEITDVQITQSLILITYDKSSAAAPGGFVIRNLWATAWLEDTVDSILRIGGSARQIGNEEEQKGLGTLQSGPGPRPSLDSDIIYDPACAGDPATLAFQEGEPFFGVENNYWRWNIGGLELTDPDAVDVVFPVGGNYTFSLQVGPDEACSRLIEKTVSALALLDVTEILDSIYFQDFEVDSSWFWSENESLNPSWQWDTPNGFAITQAFSGTKAWVTNRNFDFFTQLAGYFDDERSYLNSPCFDLQGMEKPRLSFMLNTDIEDYYDGLSMQYKRDDGSWELLGGDPRATDPFSTIYGYNWYNLGGIISDPGDQGLGWTGTSGGWFERSIVLDDIIRKEIVQDKTVKLDTAQTIRFRLAFASDFIFSQEGVGFDDFRIERRKEKILIENFGLERQSQKEVLNYYSLNDLTQTIGDTVLRDTLFFKKDLVILNFPTRDTRYDLDVRGLEYGIQGNDQIVAEGRNFFAAGDTVDPVIGRQTLAKPSFFAVSLNEAEAKINVIPKAFFPDGLQVYVVISEERSNPDSVFAYLDAVNMIPSPAGNYFTKAEVDEKALGNLPLTVSVNQNDALIPIPAGDIQDIDKARIVLIIQDPLSREVYHTEVLNAIPQAISGNREGVLPEPNRTFKIYPNPAKDFVQVALDHRPETPYRWRLLDMSGRTARQGLLKPDLFLQTIRLDQLAAGVYQLQLEMPGREVVRKKITVFR